MILSVDKEIASLIAVADTVKNTHTHSQIPLYGYFQTNSTGGFNDVTFADDVKSDHYKMIFGTDSNNDNKFDVGTPIAYANVTIPCP